MSDNYRIEEKDDPRTWGDELSPDCEEKEPEIPQEEWDVTVLEYLGELKYLIDACGNVSYFWNMKNFTKAGVNKAKMIATAYQHDVRYYDEHLREWRVKAKRSFVVLKTLAGKLGYDMPGQRVLLNDLTLSKDKRDAYKAYLRTCEKNHVSISFDELEAKYRKRILKRSKKR